VWKTIAIQGQGVTMPVRHLPGDGRCWAVLLHDAGADHRSLRQQVAAFDDGTDVLVPDLRGHGTSRLWHAGTATLEGILGDLAALIRTLGLAQVEVLGHGLGAQVAQELAHRYPRIVARLVLIAGQDHHRAPDPADRLGFRVRHVLARSVPWSWSARTRARAATAVPALREEVVSWLLRPGRQVVLALERSAGQGRHPVEHYPMPVLVLRGQHQNPGLDTVHGRIAARSPRGRAVVIDGAGYLCHLERPEQTNAAIRAFRSP
jgi:pimeloyl-ACP methyl ester carboxylesterase